MSGLMPPGALSYTGNVATPFIVESFNPTPEFFNFNVPTIWINKVSRDAFILVAKPMNVAEWATITLVPGEIETITTPDSTVVIPVSANINFLNGTGLNITGSGDNITFSVNGSQVVETITTPDTTIVNPSSGNINFINGDGISIIGSGNDITISAVGGGFTWIPITSTPLSFVDSVGYFAEDASARPNIFLPVTCAAGESFAVTAVNILGWTISQNAGQQIQFGNLTTTVGVSGFLQTNAIGDTAYLVCSTANTNFIVVSAIGNIGYF